MSGKEHDARTHTHVQVFIFDVFFDELYLLLAQY